MLMSDTEPAMSAIVTPEPPENPVPGMLVTRMLAGELPMDMTICAVTETEIGAWPMENGNIRPILYRFNRKTGGEVDLELGWDGVTITGSFLVPFPGKDLTQPAFAEEMSDGDETQQTDDEESEAAHGE